MQNALVGRHDRFDYRGSWLRRDGGWVLWGGTVYKKGVIVCTPSGSLSVPEGDDDDAISLAVRTGIQTVIDAGKWRWQAGRLGA
jgi:hypothetical protein